MISVDNFSRIEREGIHDGNVIGIRYCRGDSLTILIQGTDGVTRSLVMAGLIKVGFKNVIEGTISDSIYCWGPLADDSEMSIDKEAWRTLFGDTCAEQNLSRLAAISKRKHSGSYLVYLESSYGGTISAICADLVWQEVCQ